MRGGDGDGDDDIGGGDGGSVDKDCVYMLKMVWNSWCQQPVYKPANRFRLCGLYLLKLIVFGAIEKVSIDVRKPFSAW